MWDRHQTSDLHKYGTFWNMGQAGETHPWMEARWPRMTRGHPVTATGTSCFTSDTPARLGVGWPGTRSLSCFKGYFLPRSSKIDALALRPDCGLPSGRKCRRGAPCRSGWSACEEAPGVGHSPRRKGQDAPRKPKHFDVLCGPQTRRPQELAAGGKARYRGCSLLPPTHPLLKVSPLPY